MELNAEGNLLEIMDLARTLRQEQLFIQQEQNAFRHLTETLAENSASITRLAYICAQQRQNLNDLILARPDTNPTTCCRRAENYENPKFIDARKVLEYEHALAYEDLFNYLYRSPILLAISLSTGDRLNAITAPHLNSVIQTITSGIYGNAINTKDVEMLLKLLRELIEIQIVVSDNPRRLLRNNSSAFARLYHRLNESMFSAKIFLTAALYEPIMNVLSDSDTLLDIDPSKVIQNLSSKERLRRFGEESSVEYQNNIAKFHAETLKKLYALANSFIASLTNNWSLFPSTLRWLVQTMSHHLKQAHFNDKIINEIICDMVFTHFICPAIISPDIMGIIDAPISEQLRFNLIQIGQIIQMLALSQHESDVDAKFAEVQAKFDAQAVTQLIDLLLVSQTGEDVVAILAQQSEFERNHLLCTQNELIYFLEFFRILMAHDEEYEISAEERQKLKKILGQLPEYSANGNSDIQSDKASTSHEVRSKDVSRSSSARQGFMHLGKSTKNKIAKTMSFNSNSNQHAHENGHVPNGNGLLNGTQSLAQAVLAVVDQPAKCEGAGGSTFSQPTSSQSSPARSLPSNDQCDNESVLIFNIYNGEENKLQPLTEEEVLKMNSIGQEMPNGDELLVEPAESCNLDNTLDKSSVANGYDAMDSMNDVLRPLHTKTTRFSLSHDDASIANSDNLEAVSEVPSNHSVTSSLELEENDQNDNLSDMVSANVSGRGTPNISGRDTPSSQVTDGESVHNAIPTPQMQKLLSKARSDIEDKFCKFEIKKFEGDETVSIISDTWSTDVLASDSETLDASERERERNFSTPLIPSAVVLPGDNNFVDALAGVAGGHGHGHGHHGAGTSNDRLRNGGNGFMSRHAARNALAGFFDASDQRSESNWSTDVLASDSEKLNEIDTDDNASITAKSDITEAGTRSEVERDRRIVQQRLREVSNNLAAAGAANAGVGGNCSAAGGGGGGPGDGDDKDSGADSSAGSVRSQEDSPFFDAVNLYDEAAAGGNEEIISVGGGDNGGGSIADDASSTSSFQKYQLLSSLARSSVRTTNQLSGENNFQQNYKSSREPFLNTPRMRRQTSAESSISNQSLNLDELESKPSAAVKPSTSAAAVQKKKRSGGNKENEGKDLIDFSDFGEEKTPKERSAHLRQRNDLLVDILSSDDAVVEHRRISMEQRSAVFDGRRNGIMAIKPSDGSNTGSRLTPALRRHQSLNYENHEIMLNVNIPKRISAMPSVTVNSTVGSTAQTDDDKQQELLLCARTAQLHLNDVEQEQATEHEHCNGLATNDEIVASGSGGAGKPNKSTGAIPKSISFDASADKHNSSASNSRAYDGIRNSHSSSHNSSLFNKLKQGIFKHRRGNKSHRHSVLPAVDDYASGVSVRSVSFNTHTADVSLDLISGSLSLTRGSSGTVPGTSYSDITEDILAKYRRKVSTSSEATNSDSTCNSANLLTAAKRKSSELKRRSPNGILHDKAIAFNVIKKKIRTVLSKTDLHTSDFRHTTYSNAPPLLTYLRIQLAQALNLQNFQQISYVSEAIRCITTLERTQHTQLLEALQNDIRKRQNYLQYLMRFRQNLILIMENIEQFEQRLRSESATCNRYLLTVCVRMFLEKRETKIEAFQEEFARLNVSSDDKITMIEEFIESLVTELSTKGGVLYGMPDWQIEEARVAIERILLQRMYQQVMFPNEDADLSRDSVLSEHICKLQRVIRPSHPALCIPQEYLSEAPWLFAQQQLSYISAYKTPKEKLHCVIRCISSIMSLLHMSSGRIPAADDILPVLIYVVIMANPPYLLSTVEYITCFIGDKLDGEEEFHWTLFGSVVKFIKTMDYLD